MSYCKMAAPQRNSYESYESSINSMPYGATAPRQRAVTLKRSLNAHNNFLAKAGHLIANLTSTAEVSIPKGYGHVIVYLCHGQTTTKRQYALPQVIPEKIPLTHSALVDCSASQGWTMSREIYRVGAGEEKELSRSCSWATVSRANVVEFAKISGHKLPEWLSSWHSYPLEKKQKVYDE